MSRTVPTPKVIVKIVSNTITELMIGRWIARVPILMLVMRLGLAILRSSHLMNLKVMMWRRTFKLPDVEPVDPPMNIRKRRIEMGKEGQRL